MKTIAVTFAFLMTIGQSTNAQAPTTITDQFNEGDTNGDGFLDESELAVLAPDWEPAESTVKLELELYDQDKDGKLSLDEVMKEAADVQLREEQGRSEEDSNPTDRRGQGGGSFWITSCTRGKVNDRCKRSYQCCSDTCAWKFGWMSYYCVKRGTNGWYYRFV